LRRALEKARAAFTDVLEDLVQPRGRLVRLLGISQGKAVR
jgi:hypothetical protein